MIPEQAKISNQLPVSRGKILRCRGDALEHADRVADAQHARSAEHCDLGFLPIDERPVAALLVPDLYAIFGEQKSRVLPRHAVVVDRAQRTFAFKAEYHGVGDRGELAPLIIYRRSGGR